jgi:hypothetical protein
MKSRETPQMNRGTCIQQGKHTEADGAAAPLVADDQVSELVDPARLCYLRRHLTRKYGALPHDTDDLIGSGLEGCVSAISRGLPVSKGLVFTIACRRAADELREHERKRRALLELGSPIAPPDVSRVETEWLVRAARRAFADHGRLERIRMELLVRALAGGDSWPEACVAARIPRGSQSRFRNALRRFCVDYGLARGGGANWRNFPGVEVAATAQKVTTELTLRSLLAAARLYGKPQPRCGFPLRQVEGEEDGLVGIGLEIEGAGKVPMIGAAGGRRRGLGRSWRTGAGREVPLPGTRASALDPARRPFPGRSPTGSQPRRDWKNRVRRSGRCAAGAEPRPARRG